MKTSFRRLLLVGFSIVSVVFAGLGISIASAEGDRSYRVSKRKGSTDTDSVVAAQSAPAAAFTRGNVVIYRVGDGTAVLGSAATAVFLDEYTPAGTLVQSIPVPTTTNGANRRLTASGTATSEGFITRSTNGNYLVFTGYDAAPATASVTSSTSAAVNRVIGRVNSAGIIDTSTALTDAISGGNPRGVASTNGAEFWLSGTSSGGGIRYATLGATTSTSLSTSPTNIRGVGIQESQLYITSGSAGTRIAAVGTGTPTTAGQTITNIPGSTTTGSPYGFYFANLTAAVPGVDTLYLTDDAANTVSKYSLTSGSWTLNNSVTITGVRGLTGTAGPFSVTLYATSATNLFTFTDTTGYNANMTATPSSIATAPTNTAFRGVALAPESSDAMVDLSGDGHTDYVIGRPTAGGLSESALTDRRDYFQRSRRERLRAKAFGGESLAPSSSPLQWYGLNNPGPGINAAEFGDFTTDEPLTADFDGDGKDDITVWRDAGPGQQAYFYSINSSDFTLRVEPFGTANDNPYPTADYDGDNIDDPAVYRCPDTPGQCYFYYLGTLNNPNRYFTFIPFGNGQVGDYLPYPGDFDGDGRHDFAIQAPSPFDPSLGVFYIAINGTFEFYGRQWGRLNDRLVPGDFDGDGRSDITVTRVTGGALWWYVLESDEGTQFVQWGSDLDFETPGDYNGDGRDDFAVYRWNSTDATFWIQPSNGAANYAVPWGGPDDYPISYFFVQ